MKDKDYAEKVWNEAVQLSAFICKAYNLDPMDESVINYLDVPVILDHKTSWEYGVGSGHGDIRHWFPKILGKDMPDARKEIAELLKKPETGWKKDGDRWYYLDSEGNRVVGFREIDGETYYFESTGYMVTGWKKIDGEKYYFKENGTMALGWLKIDDVWYFFSKLGRMRTGWMKYKNEWYYMDEDGKMLTGWITVNDKQYYMKPNGDMAHEEWVKGYWWLSKNGVWTYEYRGDWSETDKGWRFSDESGWYAKDETIKINNKLYTFDSNGYMVE